MIQQKHLNASEPEVRSHINDQSAVLIELLAVRPVGLSHTVESV